MTQDEEKGLLSLVRDVIRRRVTNQKAFTREELLRDLLDGRTEPRGQDAEFFIAFAHYGLMDLIARAVRAFDKPDAAAKAQLVLPGYEHLQSFYSVRLDGVQIYMPIADIPDAELLRIAAEHRAQAAGHTKHADEIEAYVTERAKGRRS